MNRRLLIILALLLSMPRLNAQKLQLETNAIDWMTFGTINAQVDLAVARNWSVGLGGRYNPFVFEKEGGASQMQFKQRSVAANLRWWPWHVYSGWWVSGRAQWQEYNIGGIVSPATEEGQRYGGGLSAGYSYMITTHINLDMGIGFWGGMKRYTVYSCPKCGARVKEGVGGFILPNDVVIALSYVF